MKCPFRSRISRLLSRRDEPGLTDEQAWIRIYRPDQSVEIIRRGSKWDLTSRHTR